MARDTLLGFPAHTPSLPSRKIYHFIDSLKREPKGSAFLMIRLIR